MFKLFRIFAALLLIAACLSACAAADAADSAAEDIYYEILHIFQISRDNTLLWRDLGMVSFGQSPRGVYVAFDYTDENARLFRRYVLDSPLIYFVQAGPEHSPVNIFSRNGSRTGHVVNPQEIFSDFRADFGPHNPHFFGGHYINVNGMVVFMVARNAAQSRVLSDFMDDIAARDGVVIRYVDNSYNQLRAAARRIAVYHRLGGELEIPRYHVSITRNRVVVYMDITEENLRYFKENVSDAPVFRFVDSADMLWR